MKATIHVHQQAIRKDEPAIIIRTSKGSTHHEEVEIFGPSRIVQTTEPDSCGARITIKVDDHRTLVADGAPYVPGKLRDQGIATAA